MSGKNTSPLSQPDEMQKSGKHARRSNCGPYVNVCVLECARGYVCFISAHFCVCVFLVRECNGYRVLAEVLFAHLKSIKGK